MPLIGKLLRFAFVVHGFSALAFSGPAQAPASDDLLREEQLLARCKDERVQALERQLHDAAGEQRMGVLLQLADLGTARAVEVIDQNIESIADRGTLLNAVASTGHVEARPLVLRAVDSWGAGSGHPIERLHCVFGPEFAPDLRKRLPGAANDAVRRSIRIELIRLKDPQAISELRGAIAGSELRTREDAEQAIGLMSMAIESVEVAADVGRLFRRVDQRRSDVHRQLKQYAAGIALWLGDHDSAEHVIDLLASPGSDSFNYPGLHSLVEILKTHTKQTFARPEEWKAWWRSNGRDTPLFTVHVSPEDESGIVNAIIRWGRDRASGPLVTDPVVYLQDDSKYWPGRERFRARLDADIRPYTATEIRLLGKNPYSVTRVEANGERAYASLGDGTHPMKWRLTGVELAKQSGQWHVVKATNR